MKKFLKNYWAFMPLAAVLIAYVIVEWILI